MKRPFFLLPVLVLLSANVSAEGLSSVHIFPQVADGFFPDGAYYRTTLNVFSPFVPTVCSVHLQGLTADFGNGPGGQHSLSVAEGGFVSIRTSGAGPIQSGYATLTCGDDVEANVVYSLYAPDHTKLAEATVFSSDDRYVTHILSDGRDGARLGVAIANDSDIDRNYDLTLLASPEAVVGQVVSTVPARSNQAFFIDGLMNVPAGQVLMLRIGPHDNVFDTRHAAIGLRYTGNVFTTVPGN